MKNWPHHWWFKSTWALPVVIALFSGLGLIMALVADGAYDLISSALLGLPILAIGVCWRISQSERRAKSEARASVTSQLGV